MRLKPHIITKQPALTAAPFPFFRLGVRQKENRSSADHHCHDHKRKPWKLEASLHHNLQLMPLAPANSLYLTGKTGSFHGNKTEQENERDGETRERMDAGGVEKERKAERRRSVFLFATRENNSPLYAGRGKRQVSIQSVFWMWTIRLSAEVK